MTWLTTVLGQSSKYFARGKRKWQNSFVDSLRIHVQGGAGGMGQPKFGGVGGRGGRVYVEAKEAMTLKELKQSMKGNQRVKASHGQDSSVRSILGRPGDDVVIQCPTGVMIVDELGNHMGEVLLEGDTVLLVDGGVGGGQHNGFSGTRGQTRTIRLDLKLIADVALVGFPNAGKSTMLSKLSKAKPKIASYPFTTLRPSVGSIEYADLRQITVADLPGLIEGASFNRGLGHRFLRHTERSRVLLVVADVGGFKLGHKYPWRSCLETLLLLNKELELYKEYLLGKPTMLLINKMDTDKAEEICKELIPAVHDLSGVLHKFPENIRPEKPFQFVSIQTFSANKASDEEMYKLKREVRRVVDMTVEETEDQVEKEVALYKQSQLQNTEHGPMLV